MFAWAAVFQSQVICEEKFVRLFVCFSFVVWPTVFISTENNFCHSDHRPYKSPALALLSLYYMSDGIMKLKLS